MRPESVYRASHWCHRRPTFRWCARFLKLLNLVAFRAIIPPEMQAGEGLRLPHYGLGVVIHPRTVLGADVTIYHHVTLATDVPLSDERHMTIGDRVTIGAGAIILGPVKIGDDVIVGAGAVITKDVPARSVVVSQPVRVLSRDR
jgi:serine O-acetyltransferase